MPLRVYADPSHYSPERRKALTDILKPLWNESTHEERVKTYGRRVDAFEVVTDPGAADIHLLTMNWIHYVETGTTDLALRAVDAARKARRPIAVFSNRDSEANFPVPGTDIHLFQTSAYRSRRANQSHGLPPWFPDPLPQFCNNAIEVAPKPARAVLGFCGQAGASPLRQAVRIVRAQARIAEWKLGRLTYEPAPFEHTWYRQKVLDTFAKSREVETRYVLREQYRAGISDGTKKQSTEEQSRREFIENITGTGYTVCVRGGGNFSVRFYEALALGRIPVFIDTDCVLPYHDRIDWRHCTVWVDSRDLADAPAIVASFHSRLSDREYRERQLECRHLWEDRLSPDGFYSHFREHFPEID